MKTLTVKDKEKRLEKVRRGMKLKFHGIDAQIDRLIDSISSWYLYPQLQKKPTVVNLWGLTGVGKSTLVRYLIGELGFNDKSTTINFNPSSSPDKTSGQTIRNSLTSTDRNSPHILFLDEFQKYKTINSKGELEKNLPYSDLWSLLSDGVLYNVDTCKRELFTSLSSLYELKIDLIKKIYNFLHPEEDYSPTECYESFGLTFSWDNALDEEYLLNSFRTCFSLNEEETNKLSTPFEVLFMEYDKLAGGSSYSVSWEYKKLERRAIHSLITLNPQKKKYTWEELVSAIKNDLRFLSSKDIHEKVKYNQMLVITAGNQDDLYDVSLSVYLSYKDVDFVYDETKDYKWYQLKPILLSSLTPEQVSRLGVNHILFPSINSKAYKQIIKDKVAELLHSFNSEFKRKVTFTDNMMEVIYKNSVFPAQGVRPVISFIEDIISPVIFKHLVNSNKKSDIFVDIDEKDLKLIVTEDKSKFSYSVILEVSERENNIPKECRISTAAHEAGHALTSMFLWDCVSTIDMAPMLDGVLGSTTSVSNEKTDNTINTLHKYFRGVICTMLAGKAAEEVVFGPENLSKGCSSDLRQATTLVFQLVRQWGFSSNAVSTSSSSYMSEYSKTTNVEQEDLQGEYILNEEYARAKEILNIVKPVFIEMVEYLKENPFMSKSKAQEFLKKVKKIRSSNSLSSYSEKKLWNKFIGRK